MLENGDNRYDWSADGQLLKRTPKNGGVAWSFVSSFRARTNQMRLDAALGSDGTTIGFVYDPFGRLVSPQWPAPRGNEELYYDGPDVVLARRRLASGDQWVRYVHGPLDDQPLATEVYAQGAAPTPGTGSQFYYHADGEGSIRLITNAGSTVFNRYDYDSFGRRLAVVESLPLQPYGWKGREWIAGPDIYYNRARFYDPALGRFLAEDPLGYGGGDSNLYSFAWNNPKNWSDPSGLSAAAEEGTIDQAAVGAILGDGIVTTAEGTTALATGADAAFVAARSGSAVQKIGARIACTFFVLAAALSFANDPSLVGAYDLVTDMSSCAVKAVKKPQPPTRKSSPSPGCSISGFSSFEAGTPIETAQGRRPIEEIAIGDLVAARDGFTGEVGWRPVRELFRRTAPSIVHLTLDGPDGRRETLNVTSEHPFFVADKGWVEVRRLERGDRIVSEREATLAVADVSLEERSTLVYNFEVAQDHNYFVGDEGAEAHNAPGWFWKNVLNNTNTPNSIKGWIQTELARTKGDWSRIRNPPGMDCGHYPSNRGAHDPRSRLEWAAGNRARPAPYRKEPAMAIDRRHSNRVLSAAGLDGERLAQAISSGKIVFSEPAEPSSKEFVALINLANAERRSEKFTGEMLRFGKVLALEKNDTLIEFKIEDERGKVRSAVPFWPAEKYAAYARDALGLTTNIRELDILEYIFSVLAVDLPAKKLFAARFWLPSKRTVVDPPRILAKKHLESIAWYYKVESDPLASKMSDEEYRIALKDAYHRPMKCGPKGKLP